MPALSEHKTVQARILAYAEAIGWTIVSREESENEISILKIPSPPYEQQVEIARAIGGVDAKIWSHTDKKRRLEALFRTSSTN